jgi:solute:Na+ symporter, SSS family
MQHSFTLSSWIILVAYVVAVSTVGSLFYRKRSSASEYFLGGRSMGFLPVAISLVAADLSAISYMGIPAWGYGHNLELFLQTVVFLMVVPIVMYLFLPFYSRFQFYTGYEYLERRFDLKTRLLGSALFLLTRGGHVAIVIYAPSMVLSLLTGVSLWACILVMGTFTTLYTTLGGMKAVIWTDVMQFTILVTGIITVFWLSISHIPGHLSGFFQVGQQFGRFHMFNFSLNPNEFTAVWPMILGGGTLILSTMGTDQAYLQRYFATKSLKDGRKSVLIDGLIVVPVGLMLFLLGTAIFVFYYYHPDHLKGLPNVDVILPFFVVHELPGVLSGFVIASIFAASMAVMSAGINSLTTVTAVDFYQRVLHKGKPGPHMVLVGRLGTVGWGTAATVGALFADRLGPLTNAFNKINSYLGGPILGIFLLGMLSRRAKGTPTVLGAAIGFATVCVLGWKTNFSFYYFSFVGVVVTYVAGWLLSFLGPAPDQDKLRGLVHGLDFENPAPEINKAELTS